MYSALAGRPAACGLGLADWLAGRPADWLAGWRDTAALALWRGPETEAVPKKKKVSKSPACLHTKCTGTQC